MKHLMISALLCLFSVINVYADIYSANNALVRGDYKTAVKEFKKLAEEGDARAQANLGYMYYAGEGLSQDYKQAVYWYRKAAIKGNRDAQYNLAVSYAFGEGVKQDLTEAAIWYRRAGEQGHVISQYSLGVSYSYGEGVPQDQKEAAHWFKKAAEQGYVLAQIHLGSMYHTGEGVRQDYSEAARWYRMAADRGDATAQYNLGTMYRSGKGVEQNYAQATRWFRQSADQGYVAAQNELASLQRTAAASIATRTIQAKPGLFPDENIQASAIAKTESAQKKETTVTLPLADQVAETEENIEQTAKAPLFSVDKKDLLILDKSQLDIPEKKDATTTGTEITEKTEIPSEKEQIVPGGGVAGSTSEEVIKQAASGDIRAQAHLGLLYYAGKGVGQDFNLAYKWYKRAADQGNRDAQYRIANMYLLGEGIKQNNAEAVKWYTLAKDQGHVAAKNNLETLRKLETLDHKDDEKQGLKQGQNELVEKPGTEKPGTEIPAVAQKETDLQKESGLLGLFDGLFSHKLKTENEIVSDNDEIEALRLLADRGNLDAEYKLGSYYSSGEKVELDYSKAILWYRRAAQQGNAAAQYNLGNMYLLGEGVEQDDSQAAHWYALAADQGHESARHKLINLKTTTSPLKTTEPIETGEKRLLNLDISRHLQEGGDSDPGDDSDPTGKMKYELGLAYTFGYELGLAYTFGNDVPQNDKNAFNSFYEAAQKGYAPAQYKVGIAFAYGKGGVTQDNKKAVEWYLKAAEQGYTIAQRNLATMHLNGVGIAQDKAQALAWYQIIANNGNAMDIRRRDILEKQLTDVELSRSSEAKAKINARLNSN